MDPTGLWDMFFKQGQGPVASLMALVIWFVVKAYNKLFDRFVDQQKAHTDALIKVVTDNTAAWQDVKERLDASHHP